MKILSPQVNVKEATKFLMTRVELTGEVIGYWGSRRKDLIGVGMFGKIKEWKGLTTLDMGPVVLEIAPGGSIAQFGAISVYFSVRDW